MNMNTQPTVKARFSEAQRRAALAGIGPQLVAIAQPKSDEAVTTDTTIGDLRIVGAAPVSGETTIFVYSKSAKKKGNPHGAVLTATFDRQGKPVGEIFCWKRGEWETRLPAAA